MMLEASTQDIANIHREYRYVFYLLLPSGFVNALSAPESAAYVGLGLRDYRLPGLPCFRARSAF